MPDKVSVNRDGGLSHRACTLCVWSMGRFLGSLGITVEPRDPALLNIA